jgi:hypothetical protein
VLVKEGVEGAFQLRRGFFLGDGTGCGKGRQAAGVIADNMAQGRLKAVWISRNALICCPGVSVNDRSCPKYLMISDR